MLRKKKEKDTLVSEEKRKEFIREQVRPQRKRQVLQWLTRFGILVVAACVFGGIAGSVIVYIQNKLVKTREDAVEISVHASAPQETSVPAEKKEKSGKTEASSLEDANKVSRRLAAVGDRLSPCLVGIRSEDSAKDWKIGEHGNRRTEYGLLVQESGIYYYILTTDDIVQEQASVAVLMSDDTIVEGTVLGSDIQLNIAIVRIKKAEIKQEILAQMTVAQLGNGLGLINGTNVIAVGCPDGVLHSVVAGHITNNAVQAPIVDGEVQLCCTDIAYAEQGSGVVLDIRGKVAGILTTGFTDLTGTTGMSFIKISSVTEVMQLLRMKKSAPYLGIKGISPDADVAKAHQLETGAYVTEVFYDSPAYKSGMRVADVITKMDDEVVSGMTDVYRKLLEQEAGDILVCTVSRKSGKQQVQRQLKIKLE